MPNRFPEPALPASTNQAPIRPDKSYRLASHLHKSSAGQVTQITHTCEGGGGTSCMYAHTCMGMRIPARTRSPSRARARPWSYLYRHAYVCIGVLAPAWARARLHGHGHTFTIMLISIRARLRRDQRPVSANPQPVPSRKFTGPATGLSGSTHPTDSLRFHRPTPGGHVRHRFAMRRRCVGVDDDKRSLNLHVMVRPEGRTDSSPEGGLCIGAACPLTLLFTTATSDV